MNIEATPSHVRALHLAVLTAAALIFSSCVNLDSFFFSPKCVGAPPCPMASYTLGYRDSWPAERRVPETLREELTLTAEDGTAVAAVFARQPGAAMATAPTVLYHHGNSDSLDHYWDRVSLIYSLGVNVLIYDYPGYGKTPGTPTEPGIYRSARAALRYLRETRATDIDQAQLFHYGWSLGGAAATDTAYSNGRFRGLIIEATFTSVAGLVADGSLVVPRSFVMSNQFDNRSKIRTAARNATNGVLIFHGDADDFVQPRYSIELDAEIASGEANREVPANRHELVLIPMANHSTVPCTVHDGSECIPAGDDNLYLARLRAFLFRP